MGRQDSHQGVTPRRNIGGQNPLRDVSFIDVVLIFFSCKYCNGR